MIEVLRDFPDNIVAFAAKGRVTRQDYESVLIPALEEALRRPGKVRCYYELGAEFSGMEAGAMWEDFKIGAEHLTRWERVAVVTDMDWIRRAVSMFGFLVPGEFRVFATSEASEARRWIASA
jgi:hypothetical protein